MRIGEICRITKLSKDTIRFYEKKGLIKVSRSTSIHNNYKEYTEENVRQLRMIKNAKRFGFTLNEIAELLELMKMNLATCATLRKKVNDKIFDINKRILKLVEMKNMILSNISESENDCCLNVETENCNQLHKHSVSVQ